MKISIFRNSQLVVQVSPDDSSELTQIKQQKDSIRLLFTLNVYIPILIGDYIYWNSKLYKINQVPNVTESPMNYQYECFFEGKIHDLQKVNCSLLTEKQDGTNYRDYRFQLTCTVSTLLQYICDLLQREGYEFTPGIAKTTQYQTLDFNNWNVFEAITEASIKFNFDWYIEGNILNFDESNTNLSYVMSVGRLKGLIDLQRIKTTSDHLVTEVYGYGNTTNLPPRSSEDGITYDGETLTENRLSFSGVDGESKLQSNMGLYGKITTVQEFDIQPEFTGQVTAISSNIRTFIDTSIDFDINDYLIPNILPKIKFISGLLMGQTFNISYINASKQIIMDIVSNETGSFPNETIKTAIGDTYKIFDIGFPESYITAAENTLRERTQEYLDKYSQPQCYYEAKLDPSYVAINNIILELGNKIRIVSGVYGLDALYEIKELTQKITDQSEYVVKFGNILPLNLLSSLRFINFTNRQQINNISQSIINTNQITNIVGGATEWEQV